MTSPIIGAQYTNPERTGAVVTMEDSSSVLIGPGDADLWAEALAFGPNDAPDMNSIVPSSVTMRQAQRALYEKNLWRQVEDAIAAIPGPEGDRARIDWRTGSVVERSSPLVASMGAMLGMDSEAMDQLFRLASTING